MYSCNTLISVTLDAQGIMPVQDHNKNQFVFCNVILGQVRLSPTGSHLLHWSMNINFCYYFHPPCPLCFALYFILADKMRILKSSSRVLNFAYDLPWLVDACLYVCLLPKRFQIHKGSLLHVCTDCKHQRPSLNHQEKSMTNERGSNRDRGKLTPQDGTSQSKC